ncbi:unnamed protein product [Phytomonas sp. EM1]|nr:unnamed protein product [Phytomonas sp. EM1]|eukprot:CCW62492.1 unnamed protein product [Phytomonas sp. isolate EM1]
MSNNTANSADVVYGKLEEISRGLHQGTLVTIPSYELYKLAREEELSAYRQLCRVFTMHNGEQLTKLHRRMLEDLRETLVIPEDRAELELQVSASDPVVKGVFMSGILNSRENFFDGVDDVLLRQAGEGRASDDGCTLISFSNRPSKFARKENDSTMHAVQSNLHLNAASSGAAEGGAASVNGSRAVAARRKQILMSVNKAGKEVRLAASSLLYSKDQAVRKKCLEILESKRDTLLQFKEEIETM